MSRWGFTVVIKTMNAYLKKTRPELRMLMFLLVYAIIALGCIATLYPNSLFCTGAALLFTTLNLLLWGSIYSPLIRQSLRGAPAFIIATVTLKITLWLMLIPALVKYREQLDALGLIVGSMGIVFAGLMTALTEKQAT